MFPYYECAKTVLIEYNVKLDFVSKNKAGQGLSNNFNLSKIGQEKSEFFRGNAEKLSVGFRQISPFWETVAIFDFLVQVTFPSPTAQNSPTLSTPVTQELITKKNIIMKNRQIYDEKYESAIFYFNTFKPLNRFGHGPCHMGDKCSPHFQNSS